MDDVLQLFEGLTVAQAREFTRRIIPTLQKLRREIVLRDILKQAEGKTTQEKPREHSE